MPDRPKIAVVIPCYRVRDKIVDVVDSVVALADFVIVVDDCCPDKSGAHLRKAHSDPKLTVVFHEANQGVGGAMITGFKTALDLGADIVVKMDGDGQMEAKHLPRLIGPLAARKADFAKGNRFYDLRALRTMPLVRRLGNFGLTLLSKAASGFWHLSDPTNGFFALRANALRLLNFHLLAPRYFFEISLLIQLNVIRAVALDVPIPAKYADENSSLSPWRALCTFPAKLAGGLVHRIWWRYFIYDINIVTVFLMTGALLFFGGGAFGAWRWSNNWLYGREQSAGTVALAMLPVILGFQMLLQAVVLDMMDKPDGPISDVLDAGA
ncbi:MAG: glycosyltransferase family 2 protein [Chthoniobacter sp.]|uniref:glycosyltransferase family 2 protein n=1 Tax=Chthoniobacter sp. TaxID=2510640 RepID=UPI0032AD48AA